MSAPTLAALTYEQAQKALEQQERQVNRPAVLPSESIPPVPRWVFIPENRGANPPREK